MPIILPPPVFTRVLELEVDRPTRVPQGVFRSWQHFGMIMPSWPHHSFATTPAEPGKQFPQADSSACEVPGSTT
jgi:hypothetical protein